MYGSTVIDSHCHLADEKFTQDLDDVIARAKAAGVERMVCIADSLEESEKCIEIAKNYEEVFCTVGVHPHVSEKWEVKCEKFLKTLAGQSKKVRAIGEIGLDYHYNFSSKSEQRSAFSDQLAIAQELKLPVVIHCREAVEDIWTMIDEIKPEKLVLHCCTEKWSDVKRFVERGYVLSFTGIATYTNAGEIRETIKQCPLDQMMIETDAPYLAPVPHRGKRNEPAFVVEVAKLVAELKGIAVQEVDEATTRNAVEFFRLPALSAAEVPS